MIDVHEALPRPVHVHVSPDGLLHDPHDARHLCPHRAVVARVQGAEGGEPEAQQEAHLHVDEIRQAAVGQQLDEQAARAVGRDSRVACTEGAWLGTGTGIQWQARGIQWRR